MIIKSLHIFTLSAVTTATAVLCSGVFLSSAEASQLVRGTSYSLDFEQDARGNDLIAGDGSLIDNEWAAWGLEITGDSYRAGADDFLLLYDSSKAGKDNDLRTGTFTRKGVQYTSPSEGNLLILHEDTSGNNLFQPDDEALGGTITFDFTAPLTNGSSTYNPSYRGVELGTIRMVDIDNNPTLSGVSFEAFSGNTSLFSRTAQELGGTSIFAGASAKGDNSIWDFDLSALQEDETAITRLMVRYEGSGAIAGLSWSELLGSDKSPAEIPEPASILGLLTVGLGAAVTKFNRDLKR
ncbi:MAG: PEP-CTERM sorting domain-containing protein [Cyanothece sp. SIO2G6]|nr:PEP-CTERM sorting domain-containing protein [Cyanothece sp. SIO2G6]